MSRAFVKESDGDNPGVDQPERPQSPYTNYVTRSGLEQLKCRIKELLAQKAALGKDGDLSAQAQRAAIERELRYYQAREESAELVDPARQDATRVHFGATVTVAGDDGRLQTFTIVGEDEADADIGKISWISPLSKALLNMQAGDHVVWRRPAGDLELQVQAIRKAEG